MPPKAGRRIASSSSGRAVFERDEEEGSQVANAKRFAEIAKRAELDAQMGFEPFVSGGARIGWMLNMQPVLPERFSEKANCRSKMCMLGVGVVSNSPRPRTRPT